MPVSSRGCWASNTQCTPLAGQKIQEIEAVILVFIWSHIGVGIGISTPDNDYVSHKSAGMAHSRTWGYAGGLNESGSVIVAVEHVDIVPGSFSDQTAKDV